MQQQFIWIAINEICRAKGEPRVSIRLATASAADPLAYRALPLCPMRPAPPGGACRWPLLPQGRMHVGDLLQVSIHVEAPHYFSVFNLGAGGGCMRLYPGADEAPPACSLALPQGADAPWRFTGPTTAQSGGLEVILVIACRDPGAFRLGEISAGLYDLDARPIALSTTVARVNTPRLFTLPPESWDYGLVALEIEGAQGPLPDGVEGPSS
jgi:hypothetical protein